jgi:hypothetical protein
MLYSNRLAVIVKSAIVYELKLSKARLLASMTKKKTGLINKVAPRISEILIDLKKAEIKLLIENTKSVRIKI